MSPKTVMLALFVVASLSVPSAGQTQPSKQDQIALHSRLAQQYLREQRPDLAIPELQAAAKIDPNNVQIEGNLGVLLFFQGQLAEAIPHLRIAVEEQPQLTKLQGILGIAELDTQNMAQGRKDLEAAFPLITETKFKVQVGLELVSLYTQTGDLDQAVPILAELRKVSPNQPEVLYAAYRTYSDLASESMMTLAIHDSNSAQMHQMLAHEELKEGKTNDAIAEYRKAIAIDPQLPGVHFELAELLHTSQNVEMRKQAEQEYQIAFKQNPENGKLLCRLGEMDIQKGNLEKARAEYSKAVEVQPGDADAKLGLAKTLIDLGKADQALPLLQQAVQEEPTSAVAHYRLGTLYRRQGKMDEARQEIEIYKKLKDLKDKLRAEYKDLLFVPNEIRADEPDEK
jgi:tetratricopeptide (TPR) repeat protein